MAIANPARQVQATVRIQFVAINRSRSAMSL